MNPEDRELLKRTVELSEENNKILRKMRNAARWATLWGIIKFAVVILSLGAGYLYLQPYLGPLSQSLEQAQSLLNQFR